MGGEKVGKWLGGAREVGNNAESGERGGTRGAGNAAERGERAQLVTSAEVKRAQANEQKISA